MRPTKHATKKINKILSDFRNPTQLPSMEHKTLCKNRFGFVEGWNFGVAMRDGDKEIVESGASATRREDLDFLLIMNSMAVLFLSS